MTRRRSPRLSPCSPTGDKRGPRDVVPAGPCSHCGSTPEQIAASDSPHLCPARDRSAHVRSVLDAGAAPGATDDEGAARSELLCALNLGHYRTCGLHQPDPPTRFVWHGPPPECHGQPMRWTGDTWECREAGYWARNGCSVADKVARTLPARRRRQGPVYGPPAPRHVRCSHCGLRQLQGRSTPCPHDGRPWPTRGPGQVTAPSPGWPPYTPGPGTQ